MAAESSEPPRVPTCKLCNSADHKTKHCPTLVEVSEDEAGFEMIVDQGEDGRQRKKVAPGRRKADPIPKTEVAAITSRNQQKMESIPGLTAEEVTLLAKRRAKAAVAKSKAAQHRALSGEKADYPSLSQMWSWDVALNIASSTRSRMVTFGWKRFLSPVEAEPVKEPANGGGPPVSRARRPNRGLTQKLKAGIKDGQAVMQKMTAASQDSGDYTIMVLAEEPEMLVGAGRHRDGWAVMDAVSLRGGWKPTLAQRLNELLGKLEQLQPDLIVASPQPWLTVSSEEPALWERRRAQLPLWKWLGRLWNQQDKAGWWIAVVQPAHPQALHLTYMKERLAVHRVVVARCAFGARPAKPGQRGLVVEVNDRAMAKCIQERGWCRCGLGVHLRVSLEGPTEVVDRGQLWTPALCERVSVGVEMAVGALPGGSDVGLAESIPVDEGRVWEAAPVSSLQVPEENLRKALEEQGGMGQRFDFITYEGAAMQHPRRLRQMIAHLHVTLGHLSNERLCRMLALSGSNKAALELARSLRCQVCATVRPPQATPQVSYQKPKQFNERVSGDSFYIWDSVGAKFVVTHFIDGLTDYHIGDLTDRPDSTFAREILQDLWIAVFGAPDLLITDGGPEFAGQVQTLVELFGTVHEIVPEGAKWRMGLAERHGAIVKLMMMRMVAAMNLSGLVAMRQAALAAFSAKNRTCNKGGLSPMQAVTGRSTTIPGSLIQQISTGRVRYQYNQAMDTNEALQRADRIRHGAVEAFHWLDAHTALRRALTARSRPPTLEGIREGAVVYVYDPPANRRGQARRLQDHASWSGPGVIVCMERDTPVPHRLWVRLRGRVKAFPLEKVRLATLDEVASSDFVSDALKQVEEELQGGKLLVDEAENPEDPGEPQPSRPARKADSSSSSSSSSTSEAEGEDQGGDSEAEQRERRAKLLDDVPLAMTKLADRRKAEEAELAQDPHALDFAKKRKLFERRTWAPRLRFRKGRSVTICHRSMASSKRSARCSRNPKAAAGCEVAVRQGRMPKRTVMPEEYLRWRIWTSAPTCALGNTKLCWRTPRVYWTLWSGTSTQSGHEDILKVVATLRTAEQEAMSEGVTEVKTGKARIEYRWSGVASSFRRAPQEGGGCLLGAPWDKRGSTWPSGGPEACAEQSLCAHQQR